MSDLAPFVAATLRDRVVTELQKENSSLRADLEATQTVAITGPNGQPVYASCSDIISNGRVAGNPHYWNVSFSPKDASSPTCHLVSVRGLEIHVGGTLFAEIAHDSPDCTSSIGPEMEPIRCLSLDLRKCWLMLELEGISDGTWDILMDSPLGAGGIMHLVTDTPEAVHRAGTARIVRLSLHQKYIPWMLRGLDPDVRSSIKRSQRLRQDFSRLTVSILMRLRHLDTETKTRQTYHLIYVFKLLGITSDNDARYGLVIGPLIDALAEWEDVSTDDSRTGLLDLATQILERLSALIL